MITQVFRMCGKKTHAGRIGNAVRIGNCPATVSSKKNLGAIKSLSFRGEGLTHANFKDKRERKLSRESMSFVRAEAASQETCLCAQSVLPIFTSREWSLRG
jgi:hypothetical protein